MTGETELALISESQEIAMGRQAAADVERSIGFVDDAALQSYVAGVGQRLAAGSERPSLPWEFHVVDDPTANAFALPGGFIFVTRGMLVLMTNEAELASVLGHEIGHVTARHAVNQMSKAQLAQLGLGLGMVFLPELQQFGNLASTGLSLLFLKYGRDDERQADLLGFRYALENGYDVREMADVFRDLERQSDASGQSPLPTWLSSHPDPGERVQTAEQRADSVTRDLSTATVDRAEYLQHLDGLVYGKNPRNGFFRDGVFYHPDLRFRMDFPQGWQTRNLPEAVVAASPQQDAVLQLALSGESTPDAAARAFFSQQGVAQGQVAADRINGQNAVVGTFQARTQQGTLQGLAAFIDYGGRVYRVLGYSSATNYGTYDRTFRQSIASFAPVSDPSILNVKPNRVEIVRLPSAMTLSAFQSRYPSVIPIEELALINEVEGPSSNLAAGMLVKRVTAGPARS